MKSLSYFTPPFFTDNNSVSFGGGGRVDYMVKEDYKRQALLDDAKVLTRRRRRRASGSESVGLSFRTGVKDGLLLYVNSDTEFTALQVKSHPTESLLKGGIA